MISLIAFAVLVPAQMVLPQGSMCPDAVNTGRALFVTYGDGKDGFLRDARGERPIRINSEGGTVHAGGERGPKIAVGAGTIYTAWQGDYRQGAKVWFARSADEGGTFEPQRNLLDAKTPGIDHVEIAGAGDLVAVFWLDGRGGQDPTAPVTSTIWYALSTDRGQNFGPNRKVESVAKMRACACCSFSVQMTAGGSSAILYRSGIGNVRDVWMATGDVKNDKWTVQAVTSTGWKFEGCPMDGPRRGVDQAAYSIDGKAYVQSLAGGSPVLLGPGKYASALPSFATWQNGDQLSWRDLKDGTSGVITVGAARAALVAGLDGKPLIIH